MTIFTRVPLLLAVEHRPICDIKLNNFEFFVLCCRKTVAELNKELQTKTLLQLAETDRLRHTEHHLHASESKVERLNSENIKLRLKIDDLRIKLQSRKCEQRAPFCPQKGDGEHRIEIVLLNAHAPDLRYSPFKRK